MGETERRNRQLNDATLLCVTDLHGDLAALDRILAESADAADIALLGGDITNFGTVADAEQILATVSDHVECFFAVAGNCDSPTIDARLLEMGVSLFGRARRVGRLGFYGVSAMPPWRGTMYELTEEEIGEALEQGRRILTSTESTDEVQDRQVEIVLSHSPPHNTKLDVTSRGDSVGSRAVRAHAERHQPDLIVCGHIHEARGIDRIGATQIVNCGAAFAGHYAVVHVGTEIRIELKTVSRI